MLVWLPAGALSYPESGTPQGGVVSPLVANIYLHEVLDRWFEQVVKPRMEGKSCLFRYADDFVRVFASVRGAQRVKGVLPKRFGKYGLTLHPEKTRMENFRKPQPQQRTGGAGTFDLLGFTHHWGRTHKGRWVVKMGNGGVATIQTVASRPQDCPNCRYDPNPPSVTSTRLVPMQPFYGVTAQQ